MTLTEINNTLTAMGRKFKALYDRQMAGEDLTREIDDMVREISEMTDRRDAMMSAGASVIKKIEHEVKDMTLKEMLNSNEYARAFAYAIKNGIAPSRGQYDENCKILYDALTIGGGTPAGTDGGFLVPEDIDHAIRETQRELVALSDVFNSEFVSANSGWRVMDTAPTTPMTNISEASSISSGVSSPEQPAFKKVPYTLSKYAEILPVSNELAADEVAGLFAYIANFIARRVTVTENSLLMAQLPSTAYATATATHELSTLKKALNVGLDPAIAANATIITNQDGFNVLDSLEDTTGRPIVQVNTFEATPKLFGSKPIVVLPNSVLASASNAAPVYVGDMKQYATLFARNPVEILSTNIGGAAFDTDSTQVRYIKRMAAVKFDSNACVKITLPC